MAATLTGFDETIDAVNDFFGNLEPDIQAVSLEIAKTIIRATLDGIGEGDQPFAPYSPAYKKLIDKTGSKPDAPPNLRGVPPHRPGDDLVDGSSALSLDLIICTVEGHTATLSYSAARGQHMIAHQTGGGRLPQRRWFTLDRTITRETLEKAFRAVWEERAGKFNER